MLISSAYAQTAGAPGTGFDLLSLMPLLLIFVVFYFLLIRPQQKKMKQHKAMIAAVRRGDRVVTAGGIVGQVTKVINDTEVQVEIAEGVRVRVIRSTLTDVLSKTGPGKEPAAEKGESDEEESTPEAAQAKKR